MAAVEALQRAIYLLDRGAAPTSKVRAFQKAIETVEDVDPAELERLGADGKVETLPNIGSSTGGVIADALAGRPSPYLERLEAETVVATGSAEGDELLAALRGDCHSHTTWSDGGASLLDMAVSTRTPPCSNASTWWWRVPTPSCGCPARR